MEAESIKGVRIKVFFICDVSFLTQFFVLLTFAMVLNSFVNVLIVDSEFKWYYTLYRFNNMLNRLSNDVDVLSEISAV